MALSPVNDVSTPVQTTLVTTKTNNKVSFKAGDNKLEKSPKNDSIEISDKTNQIFKNVGIATVIVAGVAIAGDAIFAKGKHIKKFFKSVNEETESLADNMGANPCYESELNSGLYDPLANPIRTMNNGECESGLGNSAHASDRVDENIKKLGKSIKEKVKSFADNMGSVSPYRENGLNNELYDLQTNTSGTINYSDYLKWLEESLAETRDGLGGGYGTGGFGGYGF